MKRQFSTIFLNELFVLCFYKLDVVEIVNEHLQYEYIPNEYVVYKKILKSIKSIYSASGKLPTFGVVSQHYQSDLKVQEALDKVRQTGMPDKESVLDGLNEYIKLAKFEQLAKKVVDLYNSGEHDRAIQLQAEESPKIANFTIKGNKGYFSTIFGEFNQRIQERQERKETGAYLREKLPFGIYPLDNATEGGMDRRDTALWILRSGVGKSTALRWNAISAVRLGHNVLHIQLEGSQREVEDKYDQLWTASLYSEVKEGNIDSKKYHNLQKNLQWFLYRGKDIHIHAFEQFNTASMVDVRNLIVDFQKVKGEVGLVVIDYLKYLHPGDGLRYGVDTQSVKMRKENTADKMKNVAVEFNTRIITADQATDVPMEIWNDPLKVMDRHNISGAKNLVDSFSYVITGNQTMKEKEEGVMRLYCDKLRNYDPPEKILKIATAYRYGRFYDHKKTVEFFYSSM